MPIINLVYEAPEWWKPWANTIAYWELNWNWNDTKNNYGVTTYTATNYNSDWVVWTSPTYNTTRNWKACWYFGGWSALKLPVLPIPSNQLTFSVWVKMVSISSSWNNAIFQLREDNTSGMSSWAIMFSTMSGKIFPQWVWTTSATWPSWETWYSASWYTASLNTRYNVVITFNAWTLKFYVNWNLINTQSGNPYLRNNWDTESYIWMWRGRRYSEAQYINGYVQDVIYENAVWSDSEVLDYYNLTK